MAKRGRPPRSLPQGIARVKRKRHERQFYPEGWRGEYGSPPSVRDKSDRSRGRPPLGVEKQRHLMRLWMIIAFHLGRGKKLEQAIRMAMSDLEWPRRGSDREVERVRTYFQRHKLPQLQRDSRVSRRIVPPPAQAYEPEVPVGGARVDSSRPCVP
jgi:hypothetical protein